LKHPPGAVHPLAEFASDGSPLPSTIAADEYGRFLCELFEAWWPEHEYVRIRWFDNIAEAIAGATPACCTLYERCDSYAVVEYNGEVYPCDGARFRYSRMRYADYAADETSRTAARETERASRAHAAEDALELVQCNPR
jgi:sulfatase maturation enzyme AslB (radical SAM superfamily)